MIKLRIFHEDRLLSEKTLERGRYFLGREERLDKEWISLSYPTVSRKHGSLQVSSTAEYTDLASQNGSFLKGTRLLPMQTTHWRSNEPLSIGPFNLVFDTVEPTEGCKENDFLKSLATKYRQGATLEDLKAFANNEAIERLKQEFHGNGPLEEFIRSPLCREILINGFNQIYIDSGASLKRLDQQFIDQESYESWVSRTALSTGRRLDLQNPICEAALPGNLRFHAVLSPISHKAVSVSIRRLGSAPINETTAISSGWVDFECLKLLKNAVRDRANIVVSGGTSTGKTSLLNLLCRFIQSDERVITIEDTLELDTGVANTVHLQTRKPNADAMGEVTLRDLVQCSLRMRPDRIIVGECRGAEVLEMLQVMNTGHPGSMTTVHANTAQDAIERLSLLSLLGAPNLSIEAIKTWILNTIHLIVQVDRSPHDGTRYVREVRCLKRGILYERSTI